VPERSDVPVEVIEYEEFSQQMTYKLTPSEEEGANWFTLNVGTVGKHKVRLVLFKRDEMAFESGKVAESDPMLLKVRDDREMFLEQVRELFPEDENWIAFALQHLSVKHHEYVTEQVKKGPKGVDKSDYRKLTDGPPVLYATPYGYRQEGDASQNELALSNFTAKIQEDLKVIEGGDFSERFFTIRATRDKKESIFEVPASQFNTLSWVPTKVGALAHYDATKNLIAKCIKLDSEKTIKEVTAYGKTGWAQLEDGRWAYLHKRGAVVPTGTARFSGRIHLEGKQAHRIFPKSGSPGEIKKAVRKSFALWDLFPAEVSIPLVAGAYRAALGPVDFSIYLVGPTGIGKTSFADMVSRFFGKSLGPEDRLNFESTKFSLEREAHKLKDQIAVVDDYLGSTRYVEIMRFIARVAGNESGRGRMTEGDKPPRGLLVFTGEVQPPGVSLNARIFTLTFKDEPGWKNTEKFRQYRDLSRDGSLPLAMRAFVESLAEGYGQMKERLEKHKELYADQVGGLANHSRTPGIYGDLMVGVDWWLTFARGVGAISEEEQQSYQAKAESALSAAVIAQAPLVGRIEETDQVEIMRFVIREAIKTGKAYVSGPDSSEAVMGDPTSLHLGWKIDPKGLFLIPDTLYEVGEQMAIELSLTIPDSKGSWHEALVQSVGKNNYLLSHNLNKRRKSTAIRKVIEDAEKTVLHLNPKFLEVVS
jgi:hypothetical protein